MVPGARLRFLASAIAGLAMLSACTGGFFFAEREPWRHEAEVECINAGLVTEGIGIVRLDAIRGPGICGADFPMKVSSFGESTPLAFADDPRPPVAIRSGLPNWSAARAVEARPLQDTRDTRALPPRENLSPEPYDRRRFVDPARVASSEHPPGAAPVQIAPALGRPIPVGAPVGVSPPATLACPIVSELDRWIAGSVQPAAMRWLGSPVAEIRQISAYSCRGMNGNPHARISEHAFGNALDIAAFTLADGRTITVKNGWHGLPEEQAFLREIQAAACEAFTTVLAPGSNAHHYDHIHVDLMRRGSGYRTCSPQALSGEEIAARTGARYALRRKGDPFATGMLAIRRLAHAPRQSFGAREDKGLPESARPFGRPGEDGAD
jgi:hypothetical protein